MDYHFRSSRCVVLQHQHLCQVRERLHRCVSCANASYKETGQRSDIELVVGQHGIHEGIVVLICSPGDSSLTSGIIPGSLLERHRRHFSFGFFETVYQELVDVRRRFALYVGFTALISNFLE